MDSLEDVLFDAMDALDGDDIVLARRHVSIALGRVQQANVARAAKVLYESMDEWATIKSGSIDTKALLDILAEEGLLAPQS